MIEVNNHTAFIWDHRTTKEQGEKMMIAQPFTYVRYTILFAADLAYEKFSIFTPEFMRKITGGVRDFIMDNGSTDFAPYISGSVGRAGLPVKPRAREPRNKFGVSNFTALGVWDPSGKIVSISEQVYRDLEPNPEKPSRVHIPAGMIQVLMLNNRSESGEKK